MRTRWWVLLVLAAFFSMHGVQCIAADPGAMKHMGASAGAVASAGTPIDMVSSPAGHGAPSTAALHSTTDAGAGDLSPSGHGSPMNSAMSHLGAACLAVLSATLAALVAVVIALATASFVPATRPSAPRWTQRLSPLRPPDIFFLCVLRT
jgi:hypothetical protein